MWWSTPGVRAVNRGPIRFRQAWKEHHEELSMTEPRKSNRWMLMGLFAVFAGPILVAYVLNVISPHWQPFGKTNYGELIRPAVRLEPTALRPLGDDTAAGMLRESWTLVYQAGPRCERECQLALDELRRAHIALGKDYPRLRQVIAFSVDPGPEPRSQLFSNPETHGCIDHRRLAAVSAWACLWPGRFSGLGRSAGLRGIALSCIARWQVTSE